MTQLKARRSVTLKDIGIMSRIIKNCSDNGRYLVGEWVDVSATDIYF